MPIFHKLIDVALTKKWKELGYKKTKSITAKQRSISYTSVYMDDLFRLFPKSGEKIEGICDECGEYFLRHASCIKHFDDGIIRCRKCTCKKLYSDKDFVNNMIAKMKATNLKRYGKESPSQTKEVKNKMKATCLERYGTEWGAQSKIVQDKMKATCLETYGTEWAAQNKDVKNKIKNSQIEHYGMLYAQTDEFKEQRKQTSLKNYGTEYPLSAEEVKQKRYATNIKKYGVPNPLQRQEIKEKQLQTLMNNSNNNVFVSKQQKHLHDILGGKLNYPECGYCLDIAFVDEKTYIEYDGGGHDLSVKVYHTMTKEEFDKKQHKRYFTLKNNNWKMIRLVALNDKFLPDDIIIEIVNKAKRYLNQDHHSITIYLEEDKVSCSMFECSIAEFLSMF